MNKARSCHGTTGGREFYERMAERELDSHTVRGITYRNLVIDRHVTGRDLAVLEVGPGEGWLTAMLAARGHRVVALDLARAWLTNLPEDSLAGAAVGEMTRLPFADGSFDVVVAAEVVEHIPDLQGALNEAARVLTPGGRFVITVPYRETLKFITCPDCGERYEVNGHMHTFDEAALDKALERAGLEPETRFVGPTRFSREILRRAPLSPLLSLLTALDRLTYRNQRVSDTWMLVAATRTGKP
jgi:SAM-dependent methyltransferase